MRQAFLFAALVVAATFRAVGSEQRISVDWSPYPFEVVEFKPSEDKVFKITDFGARPDGSTSTEAINRAVAECSASGGGRVLVPAGVWSTGALVLKSGVELHLAKDAVLAFVEGPADYPMLPSPKGYDETAGRRPAPFIRADNAESVAITGEGELRGNVKYWFRKDRLGKSRPGFIWFDSCRKILIEGVRIRQAAFWTIHTRLCRDIVMRGLDVECVRDIATTYTNTDGVDIDSSSHVLIEDCRFSQDDDVICMKSGKNEVGRNLGVPTQYVAVRRCTASRGHGLLSIGSELSGGVRNIYMTDCEVTGSVDRFLRIKTNAKRGGFARDITVENVRGRKVDHEVVRIETNYPEDGGIRPPYFFTEIRDITVRNIRCDDAEYAVSFRGFSEKPATAIRIEGLSVGRVHRRFVREWVDAEVSGISEESRGWVDALNDRRLVSSTVPVWKADFSKGISSLKVERRGGAEGFVEVTNGTLRVVKTNDKGDIAVCGQDFSVTNGMHIRASARVACTNAIPFESRALLKIVGANEPSGMSALDMRNFGAKGPRVDRLVNTPLGTTETKLCQHRASGSRDKVTPMIVVGGRRSESVWSDWILEDSGKAEKVWKKTMDSGRPQDRRQDAVPEAELEKLLSEECNHTAKVETLDGVPRLLIDGKPSTPVMYKGCNIGFKYLHGKYPFVGKRMERESNVRLQVINVVGGRTPNYPNGFWTKDGFDAVGAVQSVKTAMRISPRSLFVLSLMLVPYPEFSAEHPDEVWRTADGRIAYGNESVVYGTAADFNEIPSNRWAWVSYASPAWKDAAKRNIAMLVEELRRTGLIRRVVGIHTCGFRDWQFSASNTPDCSAAMRRAWRERGTGRDFVSFRQTEATRAQNDIARFAKQCFGKDIIAMRWCFSAFSGEYSGSYDIGEFCNSDALDMLVAQPMYINRAPGVPLGLRLPTASFAKHGKLFVNEFDLRTNQIAGQCGASEADAIGMGMACGFDMWQSVYRRAAGQMIAQNSGWWFFDMAGGWYDDSRISADIADSLRVYRRFVSENTGVWHPTAAVLIDEQGSLAGIESKRKNRDFNAYHAYFAASGVSYDTYLAEDLLADPEISDRYRFVVWFGLGDVDARRQTLLDRMIRKGIRIVLPEELSCAKPQDLHDWAMTAGAYVPCTRYGLQIDMNGSFVSVHCLVPGRYDMRLPAAVRAVNLKTGITESGVNCQLTMDMQAGETRWYALAGIEER